MPNLESTPIKLKKRRYGFITPFKKTESSSKSCADEATDEVNEDAPAAALSVVTPNQAALSVVTPNRLIKTPISSLGQQKIEGSVLPTNTTPVAKRPCYSNRRYKSPLLSNNAEASSDQTDGKTELKKLTDELQKLKSVAYHKKHNDLSTLTALTEKWKSAAHRALHEIRDNVLPENEHSLKMILKGLNIHNQASLIGCDCDGEICSDSSLVGQVDSD